MAADTERDPLSRLPLRAFNLLCCAQMVCNFVSYRNCKVGFVVRNLHLLHSTLACSQAQMDKETIGR